MEVFPLVGHSRVEWKKVVLEGAIHQDTRGRCAEMLAAVGRTKQADKRSDELEVRRGMVEEREAELVRERRGQDGAGASKGGENGGDRASMAMTSGNAAKA
jgi:hypothetical protein